MPHKMATRSVDSFAPDFPTGVASSAKAVRRLFGFADFVHSIISVLPDVNFIVDTCRRFKWPAKNKADFLVYEALVYATFSYTSLSYTARGKPSIK